MAWAIIFFSPLIISSFNQRAIGLGLNYSLVIKSMGFGITLPEFESASCVTSLYCLPCDNPVLWWALKSVGGCFYQVRISNKTIRIKNENVIEEDCGGRGVDEVL